jgi:tungstate transport system substrate-binding protein
MLSLLRSRRRLAAVVTAATVGLPVVALLTPSTAFADDRTPVLIVGTSDVSDSHLVQSVIEPDFEKAYPQYDLQYSGMATGAAITQAEQGSFDGLIVHAASLENQFVAGGYSAEPAGRAIFWGDFVLAGPADDPAHVLGTDGKPSHDIVTAFEKIAAAGEAGDASFISRGGTPGTTVAEHAIWALADQSKVSTCQVSTADGGGRTPSTTTGDCPAIGSVSKPSWYYTTGATQGPNVQAADQCNTATFTNGGCYVFTDRGTYEYLQSQNPPAISHLQIVTRDNATSARGGNTALVNSFHGYVINPAKFPGVSRDTAGATALMDWITSPAGQAAIGAYLGGQGGAAFLPDAAPKLTASPLPASVKAGKPITVTGTLSNVVPGTPALNGVKVSLLAAAQGRPGVLAPVASAVTDATGAYRITYTPTQNSTYAVSSPAITKVEVPTLDPPFTDLLQPTVTSLTPVSVASTVKLTTAKLKNGRKVMVKGKVSPGAPAGAKISLLKSHKKRGGFKAGGSHTIKAGKSTFSFTTKLRKGTWKIKVQYTAPGSLTASTSKVKTVKVK